jgi:hypothetical protein
MPSIEGLEQRVLPSANYWVAAAAGSWENPNNWSENRVPNSTDDVVFDGRSSVKDCTCTSVVTVHSLQMINGYSGEVMMFDNLTILDGGQISSGNFAQENSDTYLSGGVFSWRGGSIEPVYTPSTFHIASGAYFNIMLSTAGTFGENIDNSGQLEIQSQNDVTFVNGAGITNNASGQILFDKGDFLTTGTGEIVNLGLVEKTRYDSTAIVTCQLPIDNVSSTAVLWLQSNSFVVSGTSSTYGVSVYQSSGVVELGSTGTGGDLPGELVVNHKFLMNGGALKTIGSATSELSGDATIHGGDLWIAVNSASGIGTFFLSNAASTFTMDGGTYHCTVDGESKTADLINVAGSAVIGGNAQIVVNALNSGDLEAGDSFVTLTTGFGVNANSNFHSSDPVWIPPTLNDGIKLIVVYAP